MFILPLLGLNKWILILDKRLFQTQRDLIARVVSLENSLANVNKAEVGLDRPEDRSVGTAHLENIFARLTLLENRMADIDCKVRPQKYNKYNK